MSLSMVPAGTVRTPLHDLKTPLYSDNYFSPDDNYESPVVRVIRYRKFHHGRSLRWRRSRMSIFAVCSGSWVKDRR